MLVYQRVTIYFKRSQESDGGLLHRSIWPLRCEEAHRRTDLLRPGWEGYQGRSQSQQVIQLDVSNMLQLE